MSNVYAPYNFVPFSQKIAFAYKSTDELPAHDRQDNNLLNGEVHITLKAETPVIVSDGKKDKNNSLTFCKSEEKYFIPGSTIRGMVRQNMKILSFGRIVPGADLDDFRIFFRDMASGSQTINNPLKQYYCDVLQIKTENKNGKSISIPKEVKIGILEKSGEGYRIRKIEREVIRIPRDSKLIVKFGSEDARSIRVHYREVGQQVQEIIPYKNERPNDYKNGWLHYTGPMATKKVYSIYETEDCSGKGLEVEVNSLGSCKNRQNYCVNYWVTNNRITKIEPYSEAAVNAKKGWLHYRVIKTVYLFPEPTCESCAEGEINENEYIELSRDDVEIYKDDYESRKSNLGSNKKFWELPDDGVQKPVFYCEYNGHIYFGMSRFLRIGYKNSMSAGLPKRHISPNNTDEAKYVDYTDSILGFSRSDCAYRSRVSFENFNRFKTGEPARPIKLFPASPKPSWFPGYVVAGKDYNADEFQLRGYKLYWMREKEILPAETNENENAVTLSPLGKNTEFKGVIHFKNLREEELGLLLWSLLLEEGCYQSIGMAKAYGYGRMSVQLNRLSVWENKELYKNLSLPESKIVKSCYYISRFSNELTISLNLKENVINREELKDFFFMKRFLLKSEQGESAYMALDQYSKIRKALRTTQEMRKELEGNVTQHPEQSGADTKESEEPETDFYQSVLLLQKKNGGVSAAKSSTNNYKKRK